MSRAGKLVLKILVFLFVGTIGLGSALWGWITYDNHKQRQRYQLELSYTVDHVFSLFSNVVRSKSCANSTYAELLASGAKKPASDGTEIDAFLASTTAVLDEPNPVCTLLRKEGVDFTKDHEDQLNSWIWDNQDDLRVPKVQALLVSLGIDAKRTCKQLRDGKADNYELHKAGCL